jgi:hypothetical protein
MVLYPPEDRVSGSCSIPRGGFRLQLLQQRSMREMEPVLPMAPNLWRMPRCRAASRKCSEVN